jgi:hypothetical protein
VGLDEVCFGVAGFFGCSVENFIDVLLFFDDFGCCGDPEAVPAPSLGKFTLMSSKEMSPLGSLAQSRQ